VRQIGQIKRAFDFRRGARERRRRVAVLPRRRAFSAAIATKVSRCFALSSVASAPLSHSILSASRPCFAAHTPFATTATAARHGHHVFHAGDFFRGGIVKALHLSAEHTGGRATTAVSAPGTFTSMPNTPRPVTLSADSMRFVGFPMNANCPAAFNFTSFGGVSAAAAVASSP